MKSDYVFSIAAYVTVVAYLIVLVGFVPLTDMAVVVAICIAMAGYDFWQQLWGRRRG